MYINYTTNVKKIGGKNLSFKCSIKISVKRPLSTSL